MQGAEGERARDGGGVGFCDAPSCGQFFERRRVSQLWCSDACGTRARVAGTRTAPLLTLT